MSSSILISDPNKDWSKKTQDFLCASGYKTTSAINGQDCQLQAYNADYLAVILDFATQKHSALEVLRYLRLNSPSSRTIITISSSTLIELNLSQDTLIKLGANSVLTKPFPMELLLKSIENTNNSNAWKEIKGVSPQKQEETVSLNDKKFTRIPIKSFLSGNATIFDCYIRLGPNKYLKILHRGSVFEKERIHKYQNEKKIDYLYFKTSDRATYINYVNSLLEKMNAIQRIDTKPKVLATKNLCEKYIEEINTAGLQPQLIEEGKKLCENMFKLINKDKNLARVLTEYQEYHEPGYTHLFLVSFYSSIICQNLNWATRRTIEIISFGALLHDIGKLRLPEELKLKEEEDLSAHELKIFQTHPAQGAEMLQSSTLISEPIKQIVYQHHELITGEGFPNQLTGIKIYPLAKVVTLADNFAHSIAKNKEPPLKALETFISDRHNIIKFDPLAIKALIKGFILDRT